MSIILGLIRQGIGCIATDSQMTNLTTGQAEFGTVKSKMILPGLIVGYSGHVEPCQQVLNEAIAVHNVTSKDNTNALAFTKSLISAFKIAELKYGIDVLDKNVINFLVVGQNQLISPIMILCGSMTNYQIVPVQPSATCTQRTCLPPADMSYQECLDIINNSLDTYQEEKSLPWIADEIIKKISLRSQFCGGATQVLTVEGLLPSRQK